MLIVDKSKCNGDAVCTMICPVGAIEIDDDGKAVINTDECVECLACKNSCPQEAIDED